VRPIMAPRSRPSLQHVFIPPKIRAYFDLKVGDLLKFDVVENKILVRVVEKGGIAIATEFILKRLPTSSPQHNMVIYTVVDQVYGLEVYLILILRFSGNLYSNHHFG